MLTQEKLHELFDYSEGQLLPKVKYSSKTKIGFPIGGLNTEGYVKTGLFKKDYYLHRLVFLFHHGYLPVFIDHIDHDKTNNKIENLRAANSHQNGWNTLTRVDNKSGIKNVHWYEPNKKWVVTMKINKKTIYFGSFDVLELAELVAYEARLKYHGQFACHG